MGDAGRHGCADEAGKGVVTQPPRAAAPMAGRYVERVRVEAARRLLEESGRSLEEVARRCGFSSAEVLRRCFQRSLGVSPAAYRERFAPRASGEEVSVAS
jgi:AraC-like DNA-binding protein